MAAAVDPPPRPAATPPRQLAPGYGSQSLASLLLRGQALALARSLPKWIPFLLRERPGTVDADGFALCGWMETACPVREAGLLRNQGEQARRRSTGAVASGFPLRNSLLASVQLLRQLGLGEPHMAPQPKDCVRIPVGVPAFGSTVLRSFCLLLRAALLSLHRCRIHGSVFSEHTSWRFALGALPMLRLHCGSCIPARRADTMPLGTQR